MPSTFISRDSKSGDSTFRDSVSQNIVFRNVSYSHASSSDDVFTDLDLLIDCGWRAGLVGRNGAGKSTLLGLIEGSFVPQAGQVERPDDVVLFSPAVPSTGEAVRDMLRDRVMPYSFMQQEMDRLLRQADEQSLDQFGEIQEAFQRMGGYEIDARLEAEFDQLSLPVSFLSREFDSLSGGEQTRALIAALFARPGYPLIDEPTNHLDVAGRRLLADYLRGKHGFLLVSHDRRFLDATIDHVVFVERDDVHVSRGSFSAWHRDREDQLQREARERDNIQREVSQLQRAAQQRRGAADSRERDKYGPSEGPRDKGFIGHRAAKQMKRALAVERRIDDQLQTRQALLRNQEKERELRIETRSDSPGTLLTLQNLCVPGLFSEVSCAINPGERIAVTGPNGAGKSTLLDIVCGHREAEAGMIVRRSGLQIARVRQLPRWQLGQLRDHLQASHLHETRCRQLLGVLGVSGDIFQRDLSTFSEGQRKKVELACALMEPADLLVWDEPLNFLDLMTREQIEQAIMHGSPTMLFVEHDQQFIQTVATGQLRLHRDSGDQGSSTPPSTSIVDPVM